MPITNEIPKMAESTSEKQQIDVYHIYRYTGLMPRSIPLGLGDIPRNGFIPADLMAYDRY